MALKVFHMESRPDVLDSRHIVRHLAACLMQIFNDQADSVRDSSERGEFDQYFCAQKVRILFKNRFFSITFAFNSHSIDFWAGEFCIE